MDALDDSRCPRKISGRLLHLDKDDRVVYATPRDRKCFDTQIQDGTMRMLIACTGSQMVRAKGDNRTELASWCQRLRTFYDLLQDGVCVTLERLMLVIFAGRLCMAAWCARCVLFVSFLHAHHALHKHINETP